MTAAKKSTTKPAAPEIVEDEGITPTPAEQEIQAEETGAVGPRTFTVEIDGEEIELEDKWERDNPPGSLAMISKPQYAEKYMVSLLEQLVGEDQLMYLFSVGADVEELGKVVAAWSEERGVKN